MAPSDITDLLEEWTKLVTQLQLGYNWSIYEYDNDLAVRDFLEEAIRGRMQNDPLRGRVEVVDQLFRDITRPRKRPQKVLTGWWYTRIPTNPGPELQRDIEVYDE